MHPAWWTLPLAIANAISVERMGDDAVLFSETDQKLYALNASAHLIWQGLATGLTCAEIAEALGASDGGDAGIEVGIRETVATWLSIGLVAPSRVAQQLQTPAQTTMQIRIGPLAIMLRTWGGVPTEEVLAAVGPHFASGAESEGIDVSIVGDADGDYLFVQGQCQGLYKPVQTPPKVKAAIAGLLCSETKEGFLVHGALVSNGGRSAILTAAPGVGKTTLTLALCANGFAYGGDDIVHIDEQGAAQGISFPAAVKAGAWPLLATYVPELPDLPTYERPDGKLARFVLPATVDAQTHRAPDVVLLLTRRTGTAAELEPMSGPDMLRTLLESGYAERGALAGSAFSGLARNLNQAACARLVYQDLREAVALVRRLTAGG